MPQKKWPIERGGVNEPVPISCGLAPTLATNRCADQHGPRTVFWFRCLRQRLRRQHGWRETDKCPRRINSLTSPGIYGVSYAAQMLVPQQKAGAPPRIHVISRNISFRVSLRLGADRRVLQAVIVIGLAQGAVRNRVGQKL